MPARTISTGLTIDEVAGDFFFAQGPSTNWIILGSVAGVTLIDSGYPGDADRLDLSIREAGYTPSDVTSMLVTHAHADHIGSAERYRTQYGTRILTLAAEAPHARREYLEQITVKKVLPYLVLPRYSGWVKHVRPLEPFADVTVGTVDTIPADMALPYPGGPIAIATPGHTSGHASFYFPGERILVTGDAFITGHETLRTQGPQMLPRVFHHDVKAAVASLRHFDNLDVRLILPGHGDKWTGDLAPATAAITGGVLA